MNTDIREKIQTDIFDYQTLTEALKDFTYPRDKITDLLRKKIIIRVKKGLYIFNETYRRNPISRELLANLIYGPSYVSAEYALHYHGIVPERSEALTSVTLGRSRKFHTPVGLYIYRMIPASAYQIGMTRIETVHNQSFLMAAPDKALADKIVSERGLPIKSQREIYSFLVEDLRVDPFFLRNLDADKMAAYADTFRSRKLKLLSDLTRRLQRGHKGAHHE